MRFALLGDHPDGLHMGQALVDSGRHDLVVMAGMPRALPGQFSLMAGQARRVGDIEEVLADPAVEAVVVAGKPADRPAQLRRALQSERHVLCVYPPDQTPDIAYEAALIQGDTRQVLLPLLTAGLHPGVQRLAAWVRTGQGPIGPVQLVAMERWSQETIFLDAGTAGQKPSFPGWDLLRAVGGEVAEVSAFASGVDVTADDPVLLAGRFERGGLFQASLLPHRPEPRQRLLLIGSQGSAELVFAMDRPGRAYLCVRSGDQSHEESWPDSSPWPAMVTIFEAALTVAGQAAPASRQQPGLSWQDAVRGLELDDAVRRSIERRRASTLDYQEVSEEVGFKGTMTLLGCGLVWVMILLLILARWFPGLGWVFVPLLVGFLGLQLLRWVIPRARSEPENSRAVRSSETAHKPEERHGQSTD